MDDEPRSSIAERGYPNHGEKSHCGAVFGPTYETERRAMAPVACSQTTSPRGLVLREHSDPSDMTRNLSRFEKSQAECDELGIVPAAPPRMGFESLAGNCRACRRVLEPTDRASRAFVRPRRRRLARSSLDGQRSVGHDGYVNTARMGEKCWNGPSDNRISQEHARTQTMESAGSARGLNSASAGRFPP